MASKSGKLTRQESFDILGLPHTATEEEIKSTYKRLALKHHPDKNEDKEAATQTFQRISAAYTCLIQKKDVDQASFARAFDHFFRGGGFDDEYFDDEFFDDDDYDDYDDDDDYDDYDDSHHHHHHHHHHPYHGHFGPGGIFGMFFGDPMFRDIYGRPFFEFEFKSDKKAAPRRPTFEPRKPEPPRDPKEMPGYAFFGESKNAIVTAIRTCDTQAVYDAFDKSPHLALADVGRGNNVMHVCAFYGNADLAKALVKRYACLRCTAAHNEFNMTPAAIAKDQHPELHSVFNALAKQFQAEENERNREKARVQQEASAKRAAADLLQEEERREAARKEREAERERKLKKKEAEESARRRKHLQATADAWQKKQEDRIRRGLKPLNDDGSVDTSSESSEDEEVESAPAKAPAGAPSTPPATPPSAEPAKAAVAPQRTKVNKPTANGRPAESNVTPAAAQKPQAQPTVAQKPQAQPTNAPKRTHVPPPARKSVPAASTSSARAQAPQATAVPAPVEEEAPDTTTHDERVAMLLDMGFAFETAAKAAEQTKSLDASIARALELHEVAEAAAKREAENERARANRERNARGGAKGMQSSATPVASATQPRTEPAPQPRTEPTPPVTPPREGARDQPAKPPVGPATRVFRPSKSPSKTSVAATVHAPIGTLAGPAPPQATASTPAPRVVADGAAAPKSAPNAPAKTESANATAPAKPAVNAPVKPAAGAPAVAQPATTPNPAPSMPGALASKPAAPPARTPAKAPEPAKREGPQPFVQVIHHDEPATPPVQESRLSLGDFLFREGQRVNACSTFRRNACRYGNDCMYRHMTAEIRGPFRPDVHERLFDEGVVDPVPAGQFVFRDNAFPGLDGKTPPPQPARVPAPSNAPTAASIAAASLQPAQTAVNASHAQPPAAQGAATHSATSGAPMDAAKPQQPEIASSAEPSVRTSVNSPNRRGQASHAKGGHGPARSHAPAPAAKPATAEASHGGPAAPTSADGASAGAPARGRVTRKVALQAPLPAATPSPVDFSAAPIPTPVTAADPQSVRVPKPIPVQAAPAAPQVSRAPRATAPAFTGFAQPSASATAAAAFGNQAPATTAYGNAATASALYGKAAPAGASYGNQAPAARAAHAPTPSSVPRIPPTSAHYAPRPGLFVPPAPPVENPPAPAADEAIDDEAANAQLFQSLAAQTYGGFPLWGTAAPALWGAQMYGQFMAPPASGADAHAAAAAAAYDASYTPFYGAMYGQPPGLGMYAPQLPADGVANNYGFAGRS